MRWTPIIVRNLLLGCETFNELREGAPGIPKTLLSERLRLLERYGVVERSGRRYLLTPMGRELEHVVDALGTWGARWLEVAPEHFDSHLVLWSLCRLADPATVPEPRLVIRFDLSDGHRRRFWVVLAPPDAEVCVRPPGFDEDLVVHTSSEWLAKWHMGRISLGHAIHDGLMSVEGPDELVRTLATLGLSRFAEVAPATPD
jgi:DNA-binding HxlR family transcriptional regulator